MNSTRPTSPVAAALGLLSVLAAPLAAQLTPAPPLPVDPQVTMVLARPNPVVAIAPTGSWVVAAGTRFVTSQPAEREIEQKLRELTTAGVSIDAVAFTPDGRGWTVVAGDKSWIHNVGGTGPTTYENVVNHGLRQRLRVRSVAFNPAGWSRDRGYVIVWSNGFISHHNVPQEMAAKLDEFRQQGVQVRSVAFTGRGGWSIVAADRAFTRNVGGTGSNGAYSPDDYYPTLTEWQRNGQSLLTVAFDPLSTQTNRGYAIVTADTSTSQHLNVLLAKAIREMFWGRSGSTTRTPASTTGSAGSIGSNTSTTTPSATFEVRPTTVCVGDEVTLRWTTRNADRVELSPPGEVVALQGERSVTAGSLNKFTLRATHSGSGRTTTVDRTIRINQAPRSVNIARNATLPRDARPGEFRVATVGDREVNRDCGEFTRITRVTMSSPSSVASSQWIRMRFEPLTGEPREFSFTYGRMSTDAFNGMDPRGTWKLIQGPYPELTPTTLSFTIAAEQR